MNLDEAEQLARDLKREIHGATTGITRWLPGFDGWAASAHLPGATLGAYVIAYSQGIYRWQTTDGTVSPGAYGMAALVASIRFITTGQSAPQTRHDDSLARTLRRHIRDAHRALVGEGPDALIGRTPLPDEGLDDVPFRQLLTVHDAAHAPIYRDHAYDAWLTPKGTTTP